MDDRVDYVCTRVEHQGSEPNDALTMHEDRWAYCPRGAREYHAWQATGGISLEETKQLVLQRDRSVISIPRRERSD
jgi:hypothetical protein